MAVKIRLKRMGKKKQPTYRVVVADSRAPRDGRIIERLGRYDPRQEPSLVEIDNERAQYWLSTGAQPTDRVRKLLEISGAVARAKVSRSGVYRLDDDPPPAPEREPAEKPAEQTERAMKSAEQSEQAEPAESSESSEPAEQTEQEKPVEQADLSPQEPGSDAPEEEVPEASETETGTQEETQEEPKETETPDEPEETQEPEEPEENKNTKEKEEPTS